LDVRHPAAVACRSSSLAPRRRLTRCAASAGGRPCRGVWIQTVSHLHEHLVQLIAHARTNGVVPPWSN